MTHSASVCSFLMPFSRVTKLLFFILTISLCLNIFLLNLFILNNENNSPLTDQIYVHSNTKSITKYHSNHILPNTNKTDLCHLFSNKNSKNNSKRIAYQSIFMYDIPKYLREEPRMHWYHMFYSRRDYNAGNLNFGFGDIMNADNDYYFTHMHSLETIFNERLKRDKNQAQYLTENASNAVLFHIPFPFAQHFRYYHVRSWTKIDSDHKSLNIWLHNNSIFQKNFKKKPHFLTFGRIAYETGRLERRDSPFYQFRNNADGSYYWTVSIDRNCHGDPPSCWKRLSMPHPSIYHPTSRQSLAKHIHRIRSLKRDIFVSFCGAVRTNTRVNAMKHCQKQKKDKWREYLPSYMNICQFEDSRKYEQELKESGIGSQGTRKRKIEIEFSQKCIEMYERSIFCIQEGADSTTRKGLWDGMTAGCIPLFLNGVMTREFECYEGNTYPWYLILESKYFIKQLMSIPEDYIALLAKNVLRMIPKIIYTNGDAGFADAFDVIINCLVRRTSYENAEHNPGCTVDELIKYNIADFDDMLGYTELYQFLNLSVNG